MHIARWRRIGAGTGLVSVFCCAWDWCYFRDPAPYRISVSGRELEVARSPPTTHRGRFPFYLRSSKCIGQDYRKFLLFKATKSSLYLQPWLERKVEAEKNHNYMLLFASLQRVVLVDNILSWRRFIACCAFFDTRFLIYNTHFWLIHTPYVTPVLVMRNVSEKLPIHATNCQVLKPSLSLPEPKIHHSFKLWY